MANSLSHITEYTRMYSDFTGVDLSSSGRSSDKHRLSFVQNMYKDYDGDGQTIESIPGYRCIMSLTSSKIHGIYTQLTSDGTYMVVHAGTKLYRALMSDLDSIKAGSSIYTMPSSKSTGYSYGNDLYIMDGTKIIKINDEGVVSEVVSSELCYVPTTYYNGEKYEQRNLLSDKAIEKYDIDAVSSHTHGSPELAYSVISEEFGYCAVIGYKGTISGKVIIPSKVKIGINEYKVVKIARNAFLSCANITDVIINEGVEELGPSAFSSCSSLQSIKTPTSLKTIGTNCFYSCISLKSIYLGYGLTSISPSAFGNCGSLSDVYYAGNQSEFNSIENSNALGDKTKHFYSEYKGVILSLPLFSDVRSVDTVTVNGQSKQFTQYADEKGNHYVMLDFTDKSQADGASIEIAETLEAYSSNFGNHGTSPINGQNALQYCTIAEMFDGKIFFSGNPFLPNTVFYTSIDISGANNPLYVGEHNYFNDGVGGYTVTSLLCVRDSLAVFKKGDDGTGSIFYHTKKETGDDLVPVIFPVSYVHSGVCALSKAINFLDDPVFLTSTGLVALQQNDLNAQRSIVVRSHNVNRDLLKENLCEATLLEWQGYLCVCVNGKIYLADPRSMFRHKSGNIEYEWFIINPIGSYQSDKKLYRFSTVAKSGYSIYKYPDKEVTTTIYNTTVNGEKINYTTINNVKYLVYHNGERYAGTYKPACTFVSYNNYLLFGSEYGGVFMFNNDKRGVPPAYLSEQEGFDAQEYAKMYANKIHPSFYSFAEHEVRYCITTVYDDCEVPNLTKNTAKHSLVLKYKSYSSAKIMCEIGTDKGGFEQNCDFSSSGLNFEDIDFSNFTMAVGDYFTIPINEKEKNWIEKQINIYSDGYNAPIGICSITYRYTIKGRIKHN